MKRSRLKRTPLKRKPTKVTKADALFSKYIRERDGKCVRCGRGPHEAQLQCSHFFGRAISATRFDPLNCDTLCARCHKWAPDNWEDRKASDYRDFKLKQLGEEEYLRLVERSNVKMGRREAIDNFMAWYEVIHNPYPQPPVAAEVEVV